MMKTHSNNDSTEPDYEDFRQLFAQKGRLRIAEKRGRSPIWLLRACFGRVSERAAELLEGRLVISLAGCMALILAGMSLFLFQSPHRNRELSADVTTSSEVGPDFKDFAEDRTEADRPSDSVTEDLASEASEAFIIRIGSFRNPSNAKRVVESLREQTLNVKTEVLADGLQVVTLGPFPQKGAAEDAARSVREAIGLTPQVLRQPFE